MPNRSREYDIAFRLQGLMDSSFRRSIGDAEQHIEELERALRNMNSRGDFDDLRRDADKAERSFKGLRDSAGDFGDTLKRVAEYTGAFKLVEGAANGLENIVGTVFDLGNSMAQLEASTGASTDEMQEMEKIAQDLYKTPIGEGFEDLTQALANAKQYTHATGDELERIAKNALVIRDTFGEETNESIRSADMLVRQFGITSDQAFNLLAQGYQKGLNKSGELLDTVNEFSPQFKTLGFSANQMFDFFNKGLEAGAWNLDKVGDFVKEFDNRLKDANDTASRTALAQLFAPEDTEKFAAAIVKGTTKSAEYMELLKKTSKTTAAQIKKDLKAGGTKGAKAMQELQATLGGSTEMLEGISSGAVSGADAFQLIIDKLALIQDPIQRQTLGIQIMGTQFEDLGQKVVESFTDVNKQFDMTKATMDEVAAVKYDTVGKDFQAIGRQLMTGLVIPISEDLMPVLQDLAKWATDHEDVVKALALAVPAAMIGKNAIKLVKGIGKIESVVSGATGAVGRFGGAIGLLSNPVGIAVAGVGALTLGIMAYKRHQEEARQELIHMGEQLKAASDNYEEVADKSSSTHALVEEYKSLSTAIEQNKDHSKDLTVEKERLADITQQLQEMYPETISQYDVENNKIKEKLGLLEQESNAELELARLKLEKEVADKERDLPKLEKEIQKLEEQKVAVQEQRDTLEAAVPALKEFAAEYQNIFKEDLSDDERVAALETLRQKVNEVADTVGYQFNNNYQLSTLGDVIGDLTDEKVAEINKQLKKVEELQASNSSYQELYDAQKNLIELNLGGKLEDQAKKFNSLSDEEKKRFEEALNKVNELNRAMDLLPTDKKINVDVLYSDSGLPQPAGTGTVPFWNSPLTPQQLGMEGYAEGGISTRPAIFGEAGPEIAIPLNNSSRSQALLETANRLLGNSSGSGAVQMTYAPVYHVNGSDPAAIDKVRTLDMVNQADFERRFKNMVEDRNRRRFG